jgi:hypothetical protein
MVKGLPVTFCLLYTAIKANAISFTQMLFYLLLKHNRNSSKEDTYLSVLKDMDADRKSRFASLWP